MGHGRAAKVIRAGGTKRYAPYVEAYHSQMLENAYARIVDLDDNPPPQYEMGDKLLDAFFGTGYLISSYPAIFDICGKFVAGLDIDAIWVEMFQSVHGHSAIPDAATATVDEERDGWQDEISELNIDARDSNSISSSSYVMAKALYEREYLRRTSIYRTNLQFLLLDNKVHETYLNTQRKQLTVYAIMMKHYYDSKSLADNRDSYQKMRQEIWPLTTRNYFTGLLNAMSRAPYNETNKIYNAKRSWVSKGTIVFNDAVQGAIMGYVYFGPYGAAIGAQVGTAIGEAKVLREEGSPHWFVPFIMGPEQAWILDLL